MQLPVWFETLTIDSSNAVQVWLRHPYRRILCPLNVLSQREREYQGGNSFPLQRGTYLEYKSLPPVQDCKMPVLIQVVPPQPPIAADDFILEREEFQRIVSTARSVLSLV